jgi:hypothetical protein
MTLPTCSRTCARGAGLSGSIPASSIWGASRSSTSTCLRKTGAEPISKDGPTGCKSTFRVPRLPLPSGHCSGSCNSATAKSDGKAPRDAARDARSRGLGRWWRKGIRGARSAEHLCRSATRVSACGLMRRALRAAAQQRAGQGPGRPAVFKCHRTALDRGTIPFGLLNHSPSARG